MSIPERLRYIVKQVEVPFNDGQRRIIHCIWDNVIDEMYYFKGTEYENIPIPIGMDGLHAMCESLNKDFDLYNDMLNDVCK